MPSLYNLPPIATTKRAKILRIIKPFLVGVVLFFLTFLLLNSPVAIAQLQYSWSSPRPATTLAPTSEGSVPPTSTISIPKISVQAPVIYEPLTAEASIQRALQNGVVHYGNTASPGEAGNVVVFGHSSRDWWEPGDYKFVFVLLDKLAPGDPISLNYQSKKYTYEVTGSRVVNPTDISVLNPTSTPTLTLITCTPAGTSLKRLIVTAKQISPNPASAIAAHPSLPSSTEPPVSSLTQTNSFTNAIWNVVVSSLNWFLPTNN